MFGSDTPEPRVFGLPPGADFPAALVEGLRARLGDAPPEALAQVELIVNTQRMARRLRDIFDAGPATLLPRIRLVTDLAEAADLADLPPALPPLRRRLELSQLVRRLIETRPDLAPHSALYDLTDSLAALMDEMGLEGVDPETVLGLDVSDQSGHWQRALAFLRIARDYLAALDAPPDAGARLRAAVERRIAGWHDAPPGHPVILAGSTGSRGAVALLMQAVARLPQGAVVLPGFDFHLPAHVWEQMGDALSGEDHPQFRFRKLMQALKIAPDDVALWHRESTSDTARNRLVSLALRPAPVTDQWLDDGPGLGALGPACEGLTLLEAPTQREEALAIALRLREAAETGQTAALITPDRGLTRQVEARLAGWGIVPDDSAGRPLHLSAPGRFLRLVAGLRARPATAGELMTLLRHPLTHSGAQRSQHLRFARELELWLRRKAVPRPGHAELSALADKLAEPQATAWSEWLSGCLDAVRCDGDRPLSEHAAGLRALAERLAAGPGVDGSGGLWEREAGRAAAALYDELEREADRGDAMDAADFADLVAALLQREVVHDIEAPHPGIRIWGTIEARVQGAELLILGGLNEGSWPETPAPDPWLNRVLRHRAGLLLPERRIGLAAHDFQQAAGAREVWFTRAERSEEAPTVPARWLNRLTNLLSGLPDQGGRAALEAMRARGRGWLQLGAALEKAEAVPAAVRPSPRPPAEARPRRLSVTEVEKLIRDPYAIYAKHVLRLRPLDPLDRPPDALLRGTALHEVLHRFVEATREARDRLTVGDLMAQADAVLAERVPWAATRVQWRARLARVADWIVATEVARRAIAAPVLLEEQGEAALPDAGVTLSGKADRIDRDAEGRLHIYDYKTGDPPSASQQRFFDKQLLLEAAMAERGAFERIGPAPVARAVYIGLGSNPREVAAPLADGPAQEEEDLVTAAQVWEEFTTLMQRYADPAQGFTARRAMERKRHEYGYDHLARYGEWEDSDPPQPEDLE
ncbi:double-strand break repair protein AddB [Rhodosalinus halophilus]|uniref:Double-strand break repair protein AddB n=1 Tax=Rhodosalinus halophilus TaxID=2259333 RepID=A0A365U7V6_9RHOB|nr:double-strand break repair protein AddB [Rhodosalinus halophilus]RBI84707.1 double-strand break repair protein AddB [Rhodosalinus halophilus]